MVADLIHVPMVTVQCCWMAFGAKFQCMLKSLTAHNPQILRSFTFCSGLTCDKEFDECGSDPCVYGNCTDLLDGYRCDCYEGFIGEYAHLHINIMLWLIISIQYFWHMPTNPVSCPNNKGNYSNNGSYWPAVCIASRWFLRKYQCHLQSKLR